MHYDDNFEKNQSILTSMWMAV